MIEGSTGSPVIGHLLIVLEPIGNYDRPVLLHLILNVVAVVSGDVVVLKIVIESVTPIKPGDQSVDPTGAIRLCSFEITGPDT